MKCKDIFSPESHLRQVLPGFGFILGMLVLVALLYETGHGARSLSEERYAKARTAVEQLRTDPKRGALRDHWLRLAEEFYDIYTRDPQWTLRPAALYRSAEVMDELGQRSHSERDYKVAVERYEYLAATHPQSRLADDALLKAAVVRAKHLRDTTGALRNLSHIRTQYAKGDMAAEAALLEKKLGNGTTQGAGHKPTPSKTKEQAEITRISWATPHKDNVQIAVELDRHAPWTVRMREADPSRKLPARLLLELDHTVPLEQVKTGARVRGSLLTRVMVSQSAPENTCLAFDFNAIRRFDARVEQDPFRIVLTVVAGNAALPRGVGARLGFAEYIQPTPESERALVIRQSATLPRDTLAPRTRKTLGSGSVASQLGLTVQRVFIDAGHGGKDPGTLHNDVTEHELTLDVAKRVGRLLSAQGLEVFYSRSGDVSVPLSIRPRKANSVNADIFVSIHVNANTDTTVQGFETFYLDLAKNAHAARVATLENAASDRKLGDMQNVLADLVLNARTQESDRLAGDIQRLALSRLNRRGFEVRDGGTRAAPFHVLIGAAMPAVLVELGYCTNPQEARLLRNQHYRHTLAEGIAEGILAYKNRLQQRQSAQLPLTTSQVGAI